VGILFCFLVLPLVGLQGQVIGISSHLFMSICKQPQITDIMKKIILLLLFTLVYSQEGVSQNTFFIGEKMYPCTETFTLISNSKSYTGYDLDVLIAKNGNTGFIVVSTETSSVFIKGKLMIYLEDGTIISCTDRGIYDYVDNTATTVYYLTNAEIEKMKLKNISTIRFSLECGKCISSS